MVFFRLDYEGILGGEDTYITRPSLVGGGVTVSGSLTHHIRAFFVVHDASGEIPHPGRDDGGSLQRDMLDQRILDILTGSSPKSLHVGVLDCFDGRILLVAVTGRQGGIVWAVMVVHEAASGASVI